MLHDYLDDARRARRLPHHARQPAVPPVPPSPETSKALIAAFAERGIEYLPNRRVASVDRAAQGRRARRRTRAALRSVPGRAEEPRAGRRRRAGLTEDGWVTIDPRTLATQFPGVYAVGDLANTGAPKAGVFAEGAAQRGRGEPQSPRFARAGADRARIPAPGSCYIEFGADRIARVDVDFFSGPKPTGTYYEPTEALRADKKDFGATRRARWFGLS